MTISSNNQLFNSLQPFIDKFFKFDPPHKFTQHSCLPHFPTFLAFRTVFPLTYWVISLSVYNRVFTHFRTSNLVHCNFHFFDNLSKIGFLYITSSSIFFFLSHFHLGFFYLLHSLVMCILYWTKVFCKHVRLCWRRYVSIRYNYTMSVPSAHHTTVVIEHGQRFFVCVWSCLNIKSISFCWWFQVF